MILTHLKHEILEVRSMPLVFSYTLNMKTLCSLQIMDIPQVLTCYDISVENAFTGNNNKANIEGWLFQLAEVHGSAAHNTNQGSCWNICVCMCMCAYLSTCTHLPHVFKLSFTRWLSNSRYNVHNWNRKQGKKAIKQCQCRKLTSIFIKLYHWATVNV